MVFFNGNGAVAQLGERVTGSHKVVGSIPISSTNKIKGLANEANPFFFNGIISAFSLILISAMVQGQNSGRSGSPRLFPPTLT